MAANIKIVFTVVAKTQNWMGGNRHDAKDLLCQAMLKAWKQWSYQFTLNMKYIFVVEGRSNATSPNKPLISRLG
jgi:hypothetical protein